MRLPAAIVVLVALICLVGCGADDGPTMPNVTGAKLDAAKTAIEDAGFDEDVDVDGGGIFGVLKDSNWEVCKQSPKAGSAMTDKPRLTIDRSCDDAIPDATETPSDAQSPSETASASASTSESPSASETPVPSQTPTSEAASPTPAAAPTETAPAVITAENTPEFAKILKGSDCGPAIGRFAKSFAGQMIQFDGSVADVAPHGTYETRFDYLLGSGDNGPETTVGPYFQFADVNYSDFNLTGKRAPDSIDVGGKFRFTAEVDRYLAGSCLFLLTPVETQAR